MYHEEKVVGPSKKKEKENQIKVIRIKHYAVSFYGIHMLINHHIYSSSGILLKPSSYTIKYKSKSICQGT